MPNPAAFRADKTRLKGRGAVSNQAGRFERLATEPVVDDWPGDGEGLPPFRTHVRDEVPRAILSYNSSPDIPFDRSINPYRGCEHGCIYCFARPTHAYLGLSPGLDFETNLIARPKAPEILDKQLRAPGYTVAPIAIGTNTDPYQPIEKEREIMRACLQVLARFHHPVAIVTKGILIERDLDILAPMAARGLVQVGVSVTTLDRELARRLEPRVPSPARRLKVIETLANAGIPVRLMTSPIIPGLTDHEIETLLQAGKDAGASAASWIMLRLPREVSPLFQDWLAEQAPARAAKVMARVREMHGGADYASEWHRRMRGEGVHARIIARRFARASRSLDLDQPLVPLDCRQFRVPLAIGAQLALFD